jgi:hypothetical protein
MLHIISHTYEHPLFEGAFSTSAEIYHIRTKQSFNLAKRSSDPHDTSDAPLLIYRDSDMLDMHSNSLVARSDKVQLECAADDTLFNQRTLTGRKISSSLQQRGLADFYDPSIQFWSTQKYTQLGKRSDTQGCPKSRLSKCTRRNEFRMISN